MRKKHKELIEYIATQFGSEAQKNQLVEEMSELTQIICKMNRMKNKGQALASDITMESLKEHYIEELADVNIVLQQLIFLVGEDQVNKMMDKKLERTISRIIA